MISVLSADKIISQNLKQFSSIVIPLKSAYFSCLREDIHADRDWPPCDKSLMDGIAILLSAYKSGVREFKIKGIQKAGIDTLTLRGKDCCTEIMTGAVVTKGTDCVIPIEKVVIKGRKAILEDNLKLSKFQCIKRKGSDSKKGKALLKVGNCLNPTQVAIAASVGKSKLRVTKKPRIAIISTGDEIVDIYQKCKPYQVRRSNSLFIHSALIKENLFEAEIFHLKDNKTVLLKEIKKILNNFDSLVLTGGVSAGKFDFIPGVLKELGVNELFHKVRQRPGKPFWFGVSKDKKGVFALPGNPVSSQVGTYRYVIPHLKQALGFTLKNTFAKLMESHTLNTDLTCFLPVRISPNKEGLLMAEIVKTGGSSDLMNLKNSDGFMEIPEKSRALKKGFVGKIYLW